MSVPQGRCSSLASFQFQSLRISRERIIVIRAKGCLTYPFTKFWCVSSCLGGCFLVVVVLHAFSDGWR